MTWSHCSKFDNWQTELKHKPILHVSAELGDGSAARVDDDHVGGIAAGSKNLKEKQSKLKSLGHILHIAYTYLVAAQDCSITCCAGHGGELAPS